MPAKFERKQKNKKGEMQIIMEKAQVPLRIIVRLLRITKTLENSIIRGNTIPKALFVKNRQDLKKNELHLWEQLEDHVFRNPKLQQFWSERRDIRRTLKSLKSKAINGNESSNTVLKEK